MDAAEFTHRLEVLSSTDVRRIAADLRAESTTAEGEVGWWRATVSVGCALRRLHRTHDAGMAAHRAATTVVSRADEFAKQGTNHDDVTLVARAAADVARGLVAGGDVAEHLRRLMAPWRATLGPALSAA